MNNQIFSKHWELIKQDAKKVGKGFLIALGGAVVAFLADMSGMIDYSQYGEASPWVALAVSSLSSSLINLIKKWIGTSVYVK